jgi:hypothetical protein
LISQGEAFSLTPMQTIFVADAYCGGEKRSVARADEKLTAFIELEPAIQAQSRRGRLFFLKINLLSLPNCLPTDECTPAAYLSSRFCSPRES